MSQSLQCPIRVLHVISGMGSGGAESFIMNMYRNIDREIIQFDFLLRSSENFYQDEIEKLGGNIYYTASFPRHLLKNYLQVQDFFIHHRYDIIHVHANALFYLLALRVAKKNGVACRILHSHSTFLKYPWMLPYHKFQRNHLDRFVNIRFSCSEEAGKWMFKDDFLVINNAINVPSFSFEKATRMRIRSELGILESQLVIGHVGRFLPVKNHRFLIRVFLKVLQVRSDAVLLLVGEGVLKDEMMKLAEQLGITDKILFLGIRKDIGAIMSAMDVFVFPSYYEGLGIVILEAQANGLPIICSEAVPLKALVASNIMRVPLAEGEDNWAKIILDTDLQRMDSKTALERSGYSAEIEAKRLQKLYIDMVKERA